MEKALTEYPEITISVKSMAQMRRDDVRMIMEYKKRLSIPESAFKFSPRHRKSDARIIAVQL
jgi:hypothetical protein